MAEKKKTQAEQAAKASNAKKSTNKKAASKKTSQKSSKTTKGKKNAAEPVKEREIPLRMISSLIFLGLFILLLVIYFAPEGAFINVLDNFLHGMLGSVAFIISIPAMLYLFFIHAFSGKRPVVMRSVCIGLFVLTCGCLAHLSSGSAVLPAGVPLIKALYQGGIAGTTGGLLCGLITVGIRWFCGTAVSYILFILAAVITLLGSMQITMISIVRAVKNRPRMELEGDEEEEERQEPAAIVVNHITKKHIAHVENKRLRAAEAEEARKREAKFAVVPASSANSRRSSKASELFSQIESDVEKPVAAAAVPVTDVDQVEIIAPEHPAAPAEPEPIPQTMPPLEMPAEPVAGPVLLEPTEAPNECPAEAEPISDVTESTPEAIPATQTVPVVKRKISAKESEAAAVQVAQEIAENQNAEMPAYRFPPIELLKLPGGGSADGTLEMRENSKRLNETLASFKIEAHIINVTRGPSVTRYEVELEKGVRLNKLTTAADDIALSLGASGVRIAAVPGKISVVGIEVPNRAVTMVSLREVIDSHEFTSAKSKSSFAVGKDIGGKCIIGNIAKLPHMLIAGTTGSGKSVCMNSIIVSLLYKAKPEEVKLIMVDPKMVELGIYNGIPHLLIPVVTDPKKAAGSLQWAVTEMMRRYKAMSDAGVRDLESYNSIMENQGEADKKMPQVVVIIDELADLMLVAAKEVEESICRIAQMGRAAGIHLIIATQRPSADVITGLMKANIPSRIAFAVASAMESRIILDTQGAEKLVGKGDMLFAPIGNGKPKRVQGCFVSDPEVEAVASYVKDNYVSNYDQGVMEEIDRKAAQTGTKSSGAAPEPNQEELDGDEMLPAAVDVILDTKQASVSMLQRRLKLGYARAARIVDEMEEKGIVGPFQGSKPREILITREQWEAMRSGTPIPDEQECLEDFQEEMPEPEDLLS